jgi:hypothetical protein
MRNSAGPTIVLIGGKATLESGATVDSRQTMAGDEWDVVLRQALGSSEAWWTLAKGFVDVVLAQHHRADAWALAWTGKTFKRARADGTVSRVRTKTFLDQAENFLETDNQSSGFRSDAASSRYRLVPYLLRFKDLQGGPPPAVIVGGFHTTYDDGTDIVGERPLDYLVSRWPEAIIVLPHTPIIEPRLVASSSGPRRRRPHASRASLGRVTPTSRADTRRTSNGCGTCGKRIHTC